jgi:AcrR family transcriptional regulator
VSPRPDVREARREQILEAATQLFTRKGFEQASMDDLAAQTGLSKGALYWYFRSKGEIILTILDRTLRREAPPAETPASSRISAVEGVRRFTDAAIRDARQALRSLPLAHEFQALAFRDKAVERALRGYARRYVDSLVPLIQRGINTGEFRRVNPLEVALTAGAIVEGTLLLWVYDRDQLDLASQIRSGIELLLRGLAA